TMPTDRPTSDSREQRLQEILHAYLQAVDAGQVPDQEAILRQHPDLADELRAFFADQNKLNQLAQEMRSARPTGSPPSEGVETVLVPPVPVKVRYIGDYELLAKIAEGGMGVVFKARQVSLKRLVALKMILAGELATEIQVQRFRKEAEAAAKLDHPNIVPIY